MVRVYQRAEVFRLEFCCAICQRRCRRLAQLWLAFPVGEQVEGRWVHRECTSGQVLAVFGTKRVTLMQGEEALKRLASALME